MTAPWLPPPKSWDGLSPREMLSAERVVDDGDETLPPLVARDRAKESLSIYDEAGALRLVRQPVAKTLYHAFNRKWFDASIYTHARIVADVKVAGASGSYLLVEYMPDPSLDPDVEAHWASAGESLIRVALGATGPQKSVALVPLVAGAKADTRWRVPAQGGDDAASPEVNAVEIEFDVAQAVRMEQWYWRDLAPSVLPTPEPPNLIGEPYTWWGCFPPNETRAWLTPTPAEVESGARKFKREKGTLGSSMAFVTTSENGHWNSSGPCARIVGAPLQAQTIPPFTSVSGWAGIAFSGYVAGTCALQLRLYRPSTGAFVAESDPSIYGHDWFRYIGYTHLTTLHFPGAVAQEGDRFVLEVTTAVEVQCGGFAGTEGLGTAVSYNGDQDDFGNFHDATNVRTASYTEFPSSLMYVTQEA